MTKDHALSIHESAHAICWLIEFGWPPFDVVTIERKDDLLGCVYGDVPDNDPRRALMFLAGPVAEQRVTGVNLYSLFRTGGNEDLQSAQEALAQDYVPRSLESAINSTRRLIDYHWPKIIRLAHYLNERRTLTYYEAVGFLV
jgi:hypothetical protein